MRGMVMAALAGWLAATGALAQEPRFDAGTELCKPYRKGVIDKQWQVSAPRNPLRIGQPITVGVREKYADKGYRLLVRARLIGEATRFESKPVQMIDDNFANAEFPRDFATVQALAPGTYTVLWVVADGGGYLTCDGFVIR